MDAEKYLKTLHRMCDTVERCASCPLDKIGCGFSGEQADLKKVVEVVEKWGSENPVSTRLSVFLEMFPNAEMVLDSESGKYFPKGCVQDFDKEYECKCEDVLGYIENCCNKCSEEFWEEEV